MGENETREEVENTRQRVPQEIKIQRFRFAEGEALPRRMRERWGANCILILDR